MQDADFQSTLEGLNQISLAETRRNMLQTQYEFKEFSAIRIEQMHLHRRPQTLLRVYISISTSRSSLPLFFENNLKILAE